MKTVQKKFQNWYNLVQEEVHGCASPGFLPEILEVDSLPSPSFQTFTISYIRFAKVR